MDKKCGDANYEEVNMEMSDSDGSDNEAFSSKQDYESFKQHFEEKANKAAAVSEYGGELESNSTSEYGGDDTRASVVSTKFGHESLGGHNHTLKSSDFDRDADKHRIGANKSSGLKHGNHHGSQGSRHSHDRPKSRERRRSRSGERRRRSRSRDGHGRRSRSRDRRRSRSRDRSPRRDGGKSRGGWNRDRDRNRKDRDEQNRNVEEQMKKAKEMGVEMPKYFKPGAVNPLSYAEQVQKRKMMWSKPANSSAGASEIGKQAVSLQPEQQCAKKTSFNNWEATNFGDASANEKFRRLMGIKSSPAAAASGPVPGANQEKIKEDLEKNYEVARQQTHRNRGLGLGFSNLEPSLPAESMIQNPTPVNTNPYLAHTQSKSGPGGGVWPTRPGVGTMNFVRKHH